MIDYIQSITPPSPPSGSSQQWLDTSQAPPVLKMWDGAQWTAAATGGSSPHATTHQPGGNDAMAVDAAAGTGSLRTLGAGATQACGGTDSRLSDARAPTAHTHPESDVTSLVSDLAGKAASSHTHGAGDLPKLNGITAPDGSVSFADQQATSFRIENRTSDPVTPFYNAAVKELCLVAEADAAAGMGGVPKMRKGAVTYACYLVETTDPNASHVYVRTSTGTKAIRLKT